MKKHRLIRPDSLVNDAWLRLGNLDGVEIENKLIGRTREDQEQPGMLEMRIMRDPNYLGFATKVLLDIDLLPEQSAILQELWIRPFPMYIASRGFGKSFLLALFATLKCALIPGTKIVGVGAAFRQARVIYEYMDSIWKNAPILRSICTNASGPRQAVDRCSVIINDSSAIFVPLGDGCGIGNTLITYNDGFGRLDRDGDISHIRPRYLWDGEKFNYSDEGYYNGIRPIKNIITNNGFEFGGTYNHKLKILRDHKIKFVRLDEMQIGDYILIDRSERWHNGDFSCNEDQSYALGAMIGDGSWTNKYRLRFTTTDPEIIKNVEKGTGLRFYQCGDLIHYNHDSKQDRKEWLDFWNLKSVYTIDKMLPSTILSAPQSCMTSCLQGLFDTDGTLQVSTQKGGTSLSVSFTNTSKILVKQIQFILLHYGIVSRVTHRNRNDKWNTIYELLITGKDAVSFVQKIGFRLTRKQDIALKAIKDKIRNKSSGDIIPYIQPILSKYKGFAKAKFRQNITQDLAQEFLDQFGHLPTEEIEILQVLCNPDIYYDKIVDIKNEEPQKTYDLHVPSNHTYIANGFISHNSKIRGLRAHTIIADEFGSIPPDIYEVVVRGFASVSAKPLEGVKEHSRRTALREQGRWSESQETEFRGRKTNQCIISGTADYDFKHYADYWKKYHVIIRSEGKIDKQVKLPSGEIKSLKDYYPDGLDEAFDPRDYSIVRIPYELIPKGFMDDKVVFAAKSASHKANYLKEYGACFPADSDGFFKRSLIESCVTSDKKPVELPSGRVWFDPMISGIAGRQYVYGIDPAAESDNFALIILELHPDHTRIVYGWSTNIQDFQIRRKAGMASENDYYGFCARKIRNLMRVFPTENIAIDAQGGGRAILEAFHDPHKLEPGEVFLWPTNRILDPDKELPTDIEPGKHIIHMCQFANFDFTSMSNHGTRKDFEDRVLLFPRFDPVSLEMAAFEDARTAENLGVTKLYDTLEDCVMELEELKNELCTIMMTRTGTGVNGRDRWDTPETTTAEGKKARQRKDRYSALIMANFIARSIQRTPAPVEYSVIGGFAHQLAARQNHQDRNKTGQMYEGPEWFTKAMQSPGNMIAHVRRRS